MPRPRKCRVVCGLPLTGEFGPIPRPDDNKKAVLLTVEEYETIRLIDKEGLSQEQCGEQMQVARTSVQLSYDKARRKIADALVGGLRLRIQGGDYRLCDGGQRYCGRGSPCAGRLRQERSLQADTIPCGETDYKSTTISPMSRKDNGMRIAVPYQDKEIFQHFGHSEHFELFDVEDGKVGVRTRVTVTGGGHGALAEMLKNLQADTLICGGIGEGALRALKEAGITVYCGITGEAEKAVEALLAGTLKQNDAATCAHHGEEHAHEHGSRNAQGCGHGDGHHHGGDHHHSDRELPANTPGRIS